MRLFVNAVAVCVGVATVACTPVQPGAIGVGSAGRGAGLTSIDMNMPRASDLQGRNQEIDGLIQRRAFGYRLQVVPVENNCLGATRIDQVGEFESTTRLASSIRQGCDYNVTLELGAVSGSGQVLDRVFFRNDPALRISKSEIFGKPSYQAALVLRDLGSNQTNNVNPNPNSNEIQPQPGTPSGPALPSSKDSEVTDARGSKIMLSSLFTGQYLLLDFSAPGCGGCLSMARELANDQNFLSAFSGEAGKCSSFTIVRSSEMNAWLRIFPASGSTGSHTISTAEGFSAVAGRLGRSISATPTFFLVDRAGNVVDSAEGELPAMALTACGR